jgi:hypothetical protein
MPAKKKRLSPMHLIPTNRIRLYGLDLAALIAGIALLVFWLYPVLGMSLIVVSTVVRMVVTTINARIPL